MTGYEAIGTTVFDWLVVAAMFGLLAAVFLFGQRHVIAARWRVASKHRRVRRDLHRAALVRAAQRAAADRMGAGTWGTGR